MADLKINQLDPIIPVSSGTGATYSALADGDMFIVKMKIRGTAIGDEDRKLTWLELRNSLNLGQYMPTVGGVFTGDVTLSNNKGIKSQQTGSGADIAMLYVDSSNRLNLGATTNLTRVMSSSVPQFIDGTGTYNFITTKNLPVPSDINAYTKAEVDNKDALKFDKTGGDVSGDINLTTNGSHLYGYTSDGIKVSLSYVTSADTVNFGHTTLHTNLVSTDVPKWTNGSQSYDIITRGNMPVANDVGAYNKVETDAKLSTKLSLTGGNMSGSVYFSTLSGVGFQTIPGTFKNGMSLDNNTIIAGDFTLPLRLWSSNNPVVRVGGSGAEYTLYHTGNKPTVADLGIDVLLNAKMDKLGGSFTGSVSFPNGQGISTKTSGGVYASMIYSAPDGLTVGDTSQPTTIRGSGQLTFDNGTQNSVYHTGNKPTSSDVGAYSVTQSDNTFARKGVNADITALNALTGTLKVGANATQPMEVTTLQQVQALTSGTAGAVVGVVGGFIGAVMWFNGSRATIPAGWVAADGQLLNRADYPDLWAASSNNALNSVTEALWQNSGNSSNTTSNRGMYSNGNGTSTFRVPDLNGSQSGSVPNLFLRGTSSDLTSIPAGTTSESAAPNITGSYILGGSTGAASITDATITGAFKRSGNTKTAGLSYNTNNRANDLLLDASLSSPVYGRDGVGEVRPRSAWGIWIIRASNSFAAANTNFAVYNGAAAMPDAGTVTNGGLLQSIYNVNGVQDHSVSLASRRSVGGVSLAVITAQQQAQSGVDALTSSMTFSSQGNLSLPGTAYVGSLKAFGSSPTGDISAKPSGNTWYAGSTHMAYTVMYPDGNSNAGIYVRDPVTANDAYVTTFTAKVDRNRWRWETSAGHFVSASKQGSYSSGYGNAAYVAEAVSAPNGSSSYQPLIAMTGGTTNQGYRSAISFGKFTTGGPAMGYPIIQRGLDDLDGNGNGNRTSNWIFGNDGGSGYGIATGGGLIMPTGSDERIKKNIEDADLQVSLDNINKLQVKNYILKDDPNERVTRGFIAQQAEEVDDKYVTKTLGQIDGKEVTDFRSLNHNALLADAIAAIQVLTARIAELESQRAQQ